MIDVCMTFNWENWMNINPHLHMGTVIIIEMIRILLNVVAKNK